MAACIVRLMLDACVFVRMFGTCEELFRVGIFPRICCSHFPSLWHFAVSYEHPLFHFPPHTQSAHTMLGKSETRWCFGRVLLRALPFRGVTAAYWPLSTLPTMSTILHVHAELCMTVKTKPFAISDACALSPLHGYFMSEAEKLASKCVSTTT